MRRCSLVFLGFSYQPRAAKSKIEKGKIFTTYTPEISRENQRKIREAIRDEVDWNNTSMKVEQIARKLNSKLRGWINYFGLYGKRQLHKVMFYLDSKLLKWIERKHKQGLIKCVRQLQAIRQENPAMFYHWEKGYC